jgi:hypothetical protein
MSYGEQVDSACKRHILSKSSFDVRSQNVGQGKHIAENLYKLILN